MALADYVGENDMEELDTSELTAQPDTHDCCSSPCSRSGDNDKASCDYPGGRHMRVEMWTERKDLGSRLEVDKAMASIARVLWRMSLVDPQTTHVMLDWP